MSSSDPIASDSSLPDSAPDQTVPAPGGGSRAALLIIFLTVFIDLLGFGIVLPLMARYGERFGATDIERGWLIACFSLMQFLGAPLWGLLSDYIGRRPVLLVGLAGSAIFYGLFGWFSQMAPGSKFLGMSPLFWLIATRCGAGIAGATISTAQAYIADCTTRETRGKGMALIGAAFGLGFTFGPMLGAMFVSSEVGAAPSAGPGYAAGILSSVAFLTAIFLLPETLRKENRRTSQSHTLSLRGLSDAVHHPLIGRLLMTAFITVFAFALFETTLSILTEKFHYSDSGNYYVFTYVGLVLVFAQGLFVRRMIPKLGEPKMALIGVLVMFVGMIGLTMASSLPPERGVWWLWQSLGVAVVGFACVTPSLQSLISLNTPANQQGSIGGLTQGASALARILGSFAGQPLIGRWTPLPFAISTGVLVVSLLAILTLRHVRSSVSSSGPEDPSMTGEDAAAEGIPLA